MAHETRFVKVEFGFLSPPTVFDIGPFPNTWKAERGIRKHLTPTLKRRGISCKLEVVAECSGIRLSASNNADQLIKLMLEAVLKPYNPVQRLSEPPFDDRDLSEWLN